MTTATRHDLSLLSEQDIYLFKEGTHFRIYEKLGSHVLQHDGLEGTLFAVWAPNAHKVAVVGDFNGWQSDAHLLAPRADGSGIWEGFIADVGVGTLYKYRICGPSGYVADKGDPFARRWETPPSTASVVCDLAYEWHDERWSAERKQPNSLSAPWSVYEVHLGSWRRVPEEGMRPLTYREAAHQLVEHVHHMGYTHVQLLPVMEHPFYGSWGYQSTGLFAPTARYGSPQDFMYLVDHLHQHGIGVILDWVPSHFPDDGHGLRFFDGTDLFEHADPKRGYHPEWNSYIYNYGRYEVRSFLISSAMFWLDRYHADGLRVDAVASMLYLDYARKPGEWIPNAHGGNENIEAIEFLRRLNEIVYRDFPDVQTIAEESTSWPMVSRPAYVGGLGFGMKWNMGWMHDTLSYFSKDPIFRKYRQGELTFSLCYAFSENFMLPLSHDEVVHGKGSLLGKMPGDTGQKLANLRLLLGYMYAHPGKKLLFMGSEFGQWSEWNHDDSLQWHLLQNPPHQGVLSWVRDLNHLYRAEPALHELDFASEGFEWIDFHDADASIISFLRQGSRRDDIFVIVCNCTPIARRGYRVGLPRGGFWQEVLNSDAVQYGGSGVGNMGGVDSAPVAAQARFHSMVVDLPPLSVLFFKNTAAQSQA